VRVVVTWNTGKIAGELKGEKEYELGSSPAPQAAASGSRGKARRTPGSSYPVARAKADLRMMSVAVEAYHVDYNCYPPASFQLTTPIAYLTQVPSDPFSPAGDRLLYQAQGGGNSWLAYSVGPDRKDDKGQIVFDPTNGAASTGDIVRYKGMPAEPDEGQSPLPAQEPPQEPATFEQGIAGQVREYAARAQSDLRTLSVALSAYALDCNGYPPALYNLTTPVRYLTHVPQDAFSPAKGTYVYVPSGEKADAKQSAKRGAEKPAPSRLRGWLAFSLGPDQKDDHGAIEYDVTNGAVSPGDIIQRGP